MRRRTDKEIVEQTNRLARKMLSEAFGFEAPDGHAFYRSENPRCKKAWDLACVAQEYLTDTDPNDAVEAVRAEKQRCRKSGARGATRR